MNRLTIIGNLTNEPELRSTQDGRSVCNFSVAVNRKKKQDGTQETDYFRVSAWDKLAENCGKYLAKGRKVAVVGSISLRQYTTQDGRSGASLEVRAIDIEFLSSKPETVDQQSGMTKVDNSEAESAFAGQQSGLPY